MKLNKQSRRASCETPAPGSGAPLGSRRVDRTCVCRGARCLDSIWPRVRLRTVGVSWRRPWSGHRAPRCPPGHRGGARDRSCERGGLRAAGRPVDHRCDLQRVLLNCADFKDYDDKSLRRGGPSVSSAGDDPALRRGATWSNTNALQCAKARNPYMTDAVNGAEPPSFQNEIHDASKAQHDEDKGEPEQKEITAATAQSTTPSGEATNDGWWSSGIRTTASPDVSVLAR